MRWQDETGKIIERWCHIQNASAYNTGEDFAFAGKLGTNELGLLLPIDDDTKKLTRDRRFYMDFSNKKMRYKFTRLDSVCDTYATESEYGDRGLIYIIAMEDLEHRSNDNDELEICDYFDPGNIPQPEEGAGVSYIDYLSDSIRIGGSPKLFTAAFVDSDGNPIDGMVAEWDIESDYAILSSIDGNSIYLSCQDNRAVGSIIKLKILNEGFENALDIAVTSRY